jgi:hypothetical protein
MDGWMECLVSLWLLVADRSPANSRRPQPPPGYLSKSQVTRDKRYFVTRVGGSTTWDDFPPLCLELAK